MNAVETSRGIQYSFCVVVAIYTFGAIFPLYLNLIPAAKKQVDPIDTGQHVHGLSASPRRASRAISAIFGRKKTTNDLPTTEHVEGGGLAPWPG